MRLVRRALVAVLSMQQNASPYSFIVMLMGSCERRGECSSNRPLQDRNSYKTAHGSSFDI